VLARALERYYVRVRLTDEFRLLVTQTVDDTMRDEQAVQTRLREQIARRLKELDRLEDRYVDQFGDPEWPQEKLRARVAGRHERAGLTPRSAKLSKGWKLARGCCSRPSS
jgi:hypothetical protein